jgi:hypothetical protein
MSVAEQNVIAPPTQERPSRGFRIGSWVVTGLFSAMMAWSGAMYIIGSPHFIEAMAELGYPRYFMTMLGAAKLLGVAALLAPTKLLPKTLREWAYAGFTFDLLAAIISYLAIGERSHVPPPIFALVLALASYFMRRRVAEDAVSWASLT